MGSTLSDKYDNRMITATFWGWVPYDISECRTLTALSNRLVGLMVTLPSCGVREGPVNTTPLQALSFFW